MYSGKKYNVRILSICHIDMNKRLSKTPFISPCVTIEISGDKSSSISIIYKFVMPTLVEISPMRYRKEYMQLLHEKRENW